MGLSDEEEYKSRSSNERRGGQLFGSSSAFETGL